MGSNSKFLVKNRFGIFYFQKRLSLNAVKRSPSSPKLVRLSLHTKSIKEAIPLIRLILVMWDLRAQQYFPDEITYHVAMKLFQQFRKYVKDKNISFEDVQNRFLDHFDDETGSDSHLLERATDYHESIALERGDLNLFDEIRSLRAQLHNQRGLQRNSAIHSVSLDEAFDEFIRHSRASWKTGSTMENSFRVSYYPVFRSVIGDIKTGDITKNNINQFLRVVMNLPANKTKIDKYRNKSFGDFLTFDIPEKDRLSPTTQEKYIRGMGAFLKWLKRNDYTDIDLDLPIKNLKFTKVRANEQRASFSKADLAKLFNSKEYVQGTHKQPSHFWVPLIGLYTGARLNEICQLQVADIRVDNETGKWVFDINEDKESDSNKSLKKPFHARLVPVHKKLIELGLIDYLDSQKRHKRLFSDLPFVSSNNKYGDKLQRWFNRTYKSNCQITSLKTSFHSLRHTVITHLVNARNIDPNKIAIAFGQTPQGGVTQTVYTKRQSASSYFPYFDLIDFDDCFDVKKIRHWTSYRLK